MKFLDLFSDQHIHDVLKKTFPSCDLSEILFSSDIYEASENVTIFNVKGKGIDEKYVLVKIPKIREFQGKQQVKNSKVAYPVFVLEDNNKECYGAYYNQYGVEQFIPPERNSIECLKIILHDLAEHQALNLVDSGVKKTSEYNLKPMTDAVIASSFFKDLDKTAVQQSVATLQLAFDKLLDDSNLLVRSIWFPWAKNVYVNKDSTSFLSISSMTIVPPAYDALLYIFALSDERFRQKHFDHLMHYYFLSLTEFLQKLANNFADNVTEFYREHQVKVLLPVVKFQIASYPVDLQNSEQLQEILTNISYLIKYPFINYEDIYEVTKNKLGSRDYDLLDYSLVSLSEKNGHLGEYFHLKINIKVNGQLQELQLFAKFLKVPTDLMKDIVERGPAKKEKFFYETLIPLYSKHGLNRLLDFAPKCYLARANWVLILDDLSRDGYVALKPNSILDYNGLRIIIKNMAKFHASTLILEEILTEESGKVVRLDQDYGEFLEDTIFIYEEGHPLKQMFDNNIKSFHYILEKFPEVTEKLNASSEEIIERVKNAFLSTFSKVKKSYTIRNVINHGDMYVANMLFKYDKDKVITEGILIDFQILRYISPSQDLLFFLFLNSTKETREKYLEILIEEYYQHLSKYIREYNFDPELVFPKKAFDDNINFMKSAGIIAAFMYAHITHIDPDFREEIFHDQEKFEYYINHHKNELVDLSWKNEHYRNILKGIAEDVVDVINREF